MKTVTISKELFDEILGALKDEREHYKSEWNAVGNHPASRFKREFNYFSELVEKVEKANG